MVKYFWTVSKSQEDEQPRLLYTNDETRRSG